ncbi:hypothetical protein [Larkinella sp.]|uniref:hypothetical protein n=1 Tax=Larkinella sp. TaxID=2034517 RepID=UPI003BAD2BDF
MNAVGENWRTNQYVHLDLNPAINWLILSEGILMVYFLFGIGLGFYFHQYSMLVFHSMLAVGFGLVFLYSLAHSKIID